MGIKPWLSLSVFAGTLVALAGCQNTPERKQTIASVPPPQPRVAQQSQPTPPPTFPTAQNANQPYSPNSQPFSSNVGSPNTAPGYPSSGYTTTPAGAGNRVQATPYTSPNAVQPIGGANSNPPAGLPQLGGSPTPTLPNGAGGLQPPPSFPPGPNGFGVDRPNPLPGAAPDLTAPKLSN